jgi:hypothetical protein
MTMVDAMNQDNYEARIAELEAVLGEFVKDVNDSGGVSFSRDGTAHPVADLSWTDLGATYVMACDALGLTPGEDGDDCEDEDETNSQDD